MEECILSSIPVEGYILHLLFFLVNASVITTIITSDSTAPAPSATATTTLLLLKLKLLFQLYCSGPLNENLCLTTLLLYFYRSSLLSLFINGCVTAACNVCGLFAFVNFYHLFVAGCLEFCVVPPSTINTYCWCRIMCCSK